MKVLIINISMIGDNDATGITLNNLFEGLPGVKIMQICVDTVNREYHSQKEKVLFIEPASVPFDLIIRKTLRLFVKTGNLKLGPKSGLVPQKGVKNALHDFLRGLIDMSPVFLTKAFKQKIDAFKPDVIYTMGANIRTLRLSNYFTKRFYIPAVLHLMDNWPKTIYTTSSLSKFARYSLLTELRKLHSRSKLCLSISNEMAQIYSKRYGVNYETVGNIFDLDDRFLYEENRDGEKDDVFTLVYAGGLHLNRYKSLKMLAMVIENMKTDKKIVLHLYVPKEDKLGYKDLLNYDFAIFHSYLNKDDLINVYKNSDCLVHVESFDENIYEFIRYSISTKIPEYVGCGKPILCLAPDSIAVSKFISENKVGYVADNEKSLEAGLNILLNDKKAYEDFVNNAKTVSLQFKRYVVQEKLMNALGQGKR